jgi:trans-aconitate methyltransferase
MTDKLKEFLSTAFTADTKFAGHMKYKYSGRNLIDEVNSLNPKLVIDVGCGTNVYKKYIKNLIGFDQAPYPQADFQAFLEDAVFEPESADVIMCLGSLHFGTREQVYEKFDRVIKWLSPGGHIIMRTMLSMEMPDFANSFFYIWTPEDIEYLGQLHNLKVVKGPFEDTGTGTRTVWWWQKSL